MNRTALLTTTALVALSTGSVLAAGQVRGAGSDNWLQVPKSAKVLWNQNSNNAGEGIISMNFTSTGTAFNSQAADDFVVPKGKMWTIKEVDVSGVYYEGSGPATSENIVFYKNANGMPGTPVRKGTFNNLQGLGSGGDFAIALPENGLRLKSGHYWLSVIANVFYADNGEWAWDVNSVQHGDQAMWQNQGGGFGFCQTWDTIQNCLGYGPDIMFELKGTSK